MYFFLDRPNTRNCRGVLESKKPWSAESVEHLDHILPTVLFVSEAQMGKYPPEEPSRIFQTRIVWVFFPPDHVILQMVHKCESFST